MRDSSRFKSIKSTKSTRDPVLLPLNCYQCGGHIEIAFEPSRRNDDDPQTVRFTCPYCDAPREFEAPGRVVWVASRQTGLGPEIKH